MKPDVQSEVTKDTLAMARPTSRTSDSLVAQDRQSTTESSFDQADVLFSISSTPTLISRAVSPSRLSEHQEISEPEPPGDAFSRNPSRHNCNSHTGAATAFGDGDSGSSDGWDALSDASSDWSHLAASDTSEQLLR